jgi:hypothetical protein
MMYGAVKWGEAASQAPSGSTPAAMRAADTIADNLPSYPIPKSNYDKVYMAQQGDEAKYVVEDAYPSVEVGSKRFVLLRNMVNKQIPASDEYNQSHPEERAVPLDIPAVPVQLTKSAHVPEENTEAFYDGDYKDAKGS